LFLYQGFLKKISAAWKAVQCFRQYVCTSQLYLFNGSDNSSAYCTKSCPTQATGSFLYHASISTDSTLEALERRCAVRLFFLQLYVDITSLFHCI